MLGTIARYHCMQFQGKRMNQTWENGKKSRFWSIWAKFRPPNFFSLENPTPWVTRYHGQLSSCITSEKTNDPVLRKLSDGRRDGQTDRETDGQATRVISWWDLPQPDVIHCSKLSLYAISRKTNQSNLKIWQKKLVLDPILVLLAQIWTPELFFTDFLSTIR